MKISQIFWFPIIAFMFAGFTFLTLCFSDIKGIPSIPLYFALDYYFLSLFWCKGRGGKSTVIYPHYSNHFLNFKLINFRLLGGKVLKPLYRFLLTFVFFFICNLIVNILLKHNLNILTAFSVALGSSLGLFLVEMYAIKKFKDVKDE